MNLNQQVFQKVSEAKKQILVVTKYLTPEETNKLLPELQSMSCVLGAGENRAENLEAKNIPRAFCHFIGNIQSRKIPEIVKHCSVLQSLDNLKHARIINQEIEKQNLEPINIFIQINISNELQKGGIDPEQLPVFLSEIVKLKNIKVMGISAMGTFVSSVDEKRSEFEQLKNLQKNYLPEGKISAGTSQDYEIALEEGIDIVRVGRGCFTQ